MSAPQRTPRKPLPPELSQKLDETKRKTNAAVTLQSAIRGFLGRKEHQRLQTLSNIGSQAYQQLRVYHGTHDAHAQGILQHGLVPQGGEGLSPMIGDASASRGKVFFTRDKEQAAYYARTVTGMAQVERVERAIQAEDLDAMEHAKGKPLKPAIMRVLVPPSVQKDAQADPKGDKHDYTLERSLQPGLVLPGHLEPDADVSQRRGAVTLFQRELNRRGANATRSEAEQTLSRMRRNSIAREHEALESPYAVESANLALDKFKGSRGGL